MPEDYFRGDSHVSLKKEPVLRDSDAKLTSTIPIDLMVDDEWAVAEPYLKSEEHYPIGGGENVGKISYHGYDPSEESLQLYMQTGIMLYYALGACVTTGTALATPFADTVISVDGTFLIWTMTTNTAMTIDEHAGRTIEVQTGDHAGELYLIVSNTADTITVNHAASALIATDTIKITEAPYTHTITESRNRPSFGLHVEQRNATAAQNIIIDLLGCIVKALSMAIEKDGDGMWEVSPSIAKGIPSDLIGALPANFVDVIKTWTHVTSSTLTYNSANVFTAADVDSIGLDITNNSELLPMQGDEHAQKHKKGTREYLWKFHLFPQNNVLYGLRNTKHTDYLTYIAYEFKIAPSATNYIKLDFSRLRLTEYPNKIPSKDDNIIGVDAEFRVAPDNVMECEVMDDRDYTYYENH